MLIAYAAAEGELASDVGADVGPYAKVLAEELVKPGIEAVAMCRVVQRRVRMAIRQEPYLGFNAMGDVYLAGAELPKQPVAVPDVTEAMREWAAIDKTSVVELETFVQRHGSSPEAAYARARIDNLKRQQVTSAAPKTEKPTTVTGTLRCESYSGRADCELDTFCSWAEDKKQCQRKSGSLTTALLEASPPSKATSTVSCADVVSWLERRPVLEAVSRNLRAQGALTGKVVPFRKLDGWLMAKLDECTRKAQETAAHRSNWFD
jgi:hypothetical protein